MKNEKRFEKENAIIDSAEKVFQQVGFKNAKMEDIASEAGITKVTLYSYFQSKENLYLAITHRAIQNLCDRFYTILVANKNESAINNVLQLSASFMDYCSDNYLYSEALLDYFVMVRSSASGKDTSKLTDGVLESIYYRKIQDIQNLPFKIIAKEVQKGQKDKSIHTKIDPMLYTLHAWTAGLGYIKVLNSAGDTTLFNINVSKLRDLNLEVAEQILNGKLEI